MHPFYSLLATELWQEDRLREAEMARRYPRPTRPARRTVRKAIGYVLVEVGLRLAVREPAVRAHTPVGVSR